MTDRVEVRIVGDDSGAQAALRRTSSAVSDAASTMRTKLAEIQASSRSAFGTMGSEAKEGASDVDRAMGGMGSTFDKVKAHFASFITGFKQGWRDADTEIKQAARSAEGAGNAMGGLGAKGGGLSLAMGVFKGGLLLEGARQLKDIAVASVQTSAEFERLRSVLTTLSGSSAGGEAQFGELKKFATETPYQLTEVVGAFSKLKAQGLDPSNAALKSYGNTAAAMGKSLDQMVEAVADAAMGEYERLKEFGIKASDAGDRVIFNFKGQATSIAKNSADIQAYLQNIGNTDFAGAMERQMDTLGGKFSNLADAAASFADEMGQGGLSQALKDASDAMTLSTVSSTELARGIGQVLGVAISSVVEIVRTMSGVFNETFSLIGQIVTDVMGKSAGSAVTFGNTLKFVGALVSAFADVVQWAFQILHTAVQTGVNAVTTYATAVQRALSFDFSGAVQAVADGVNRQADIFSNGVDRMVEINRKGQQRIAGIWAGNAKSPQTMALDMWSEALGALKTMPTSAPGSGAGGAAKRSGGAKSGGGAKVTELDQWRAQLQDGVLEQEKAGQDVIGFIAQFWQQKLALTKSGTKQELDVRRELGRAQIALSRETQREEIAQIRDRQQTKLDAAQSEIDLTRLSLQAKLDAIEQEAQAGNLSQVDALRQKALVNAEIYQLDLDLEQKQREIKIAGLREQQKLYAEGTREYRNFTRQLEIVEAQHNQRMAVLNRQNDLRRSRDEAATAAAQRKRMEGLASTWAEQLARMATLQQGFAATLRGMWDGLVNLFSQNIARMLQQWIMMLLVKETTSQSLHLKETMRLAKQAAAGAFAATAKIPIIGPALAPIAAAAAFAATIAFSAKGGYDVPGMAGPGVDGRGGQLGVVHPREMVLPADIADQFRSGGMGGMSVHISAIDARSVKRLFMDHNSDLADALRKHVRDGGRG